ncbi:MAG: hypothetical protein V4660_17370 [Pseudomonadota bacterium]
MRKLTMKEMMAVAGGGCTTTWSPYSGYTTTCTPACTTQWVPYVGYVCR